MDTFFFFLFGFQPFVLRSPTHKVVGLPKMIARHLERFYASASSTPTLDGQWAMEEISSTRPTGEMYGHNN
jgi:hypothetical protein